MRFANRQSLRHLSQRLSLVVVLIFGLGNGEVFGQPTQQGPVPIAVNGRPFGVWAVEIPLPQDWDGREPRVLVAEQNGNIYYPAVRVLTVEVREKPEAQPLPRIGRPGGLIDRVRNVLQPAGEKKQLPVAVQISGLFKNADNLALQVYGDIQQRIEFDTQHAPSIPHRKLLELWWDAYTQNAQQLLSGDESPRLVPYYLTDMLARRLELPMPQLAPPKSEPEQQNQPLENLAMLAAIEPLRDQILIDLIERPRGVSELTDLPSEPQWQPSPLAPLDDQILIEPIAQRVPPECFYLRFGSFANYVWFQELAERFGGDLTQSVFLRGFDYEATARIERMMATKLTTVAKMFGDKLVSDMALFGSDLYMKEGASLGVVFHASNPSLLKSAIESDRNAALGKNADARLQNLQIEGHEVSFLSTPDNRLRSFFVADEDYFLITTSRYLVERFLQVGGGQPSLASNTSFRWARRWMPESSGYSVFGYFSPEFFHRLAGPQYQIELRRRLEAVAHLEVAEIASLSAKAEDYDAEPSVSQLKDAGWLPPWFDMRSDGARVLRSNGRWVDATRGARGSFLPISDVPVREVSTDEAVEYARMADYYQRQWLRMDPLLLGVRRFQGEQGTGENVAFEAHVAPFEPKKYGWIAQQLAEPSPIEINLPHDDAASVQLHVHGDAAGESYYLFAGVKDMLPPEPEDVQGLVKVVRALKSAPAYIGAWPKPSLIEQLPLGLGAALGRPDYAGFSRMIGGLWRWQDAQWSLLSFDRTILDQAISQLGTSEVTDHAQIRASFANLQDTRLSQWVNNLWWQRGWRASHANAELLDAVHQQLKVPADQCLDAANRLLDVRLQCPLHGEYQLQTVNGGQQDIGRWNSTAWKLGATSSNGKPLPPPEYQAPWIEWFRGGRIQATQQPASLSVVGVVQLELPPLRVDLTEPEQPALLPTLDFDLFSLPMKMFGKGEDGQTEKAENNRSSF